MVDGNGLENRRAGNGTVGSNPTPSARLNNLNAAMQALLIVFPALTAFFVANGQP